MHIQLVDVSPRDGLQNEPVVLDTDTKVALIRQAIDAGARRIEATAFVQPAQVPQLADAEDVMAAVPRRSDVSYIGLALNRRGVDRAIAAGCDEINLVVVATDTFCRRNQGRSTAETMADHGSAIASINSAGRRTSLTIGAAFGCPFEGEVPLGRVVDLARQARDLGVDEVALADTIGVAVPRDITTRVESVAAVLDQIPLRVHLHDTRHTGIANAQAAIDAGVRILDASIGGMGGCPFAPNATGNVAMEDLLYLLDRSGYQHGWDFDRVAPIVAWLEERLGRDLPGMASKAGHFPIIA